MIRFKVFLLFLLSVCYIVSCKIADHQKNESNLSIQQKQLLIQLLLLSHNAIRYGNNIENLFLIDHLNDGCVRKVKEFIHKCPDGYLCERLNIFDVVDDARVIYFYDNRNSVEIKSFDNNDLKITFKTLDEIEMITTYSYYSDTLNAKIRFSENKDSVYFVASDSDFNVFFTKLDSVSWKIGSLDESDLFLRIDLETNDNNFLSRMRVIESRKNMEGRVVLDTLVYYDFFYSYNEKDKWISCDVYDLRKNGYKKAGTIVRLYWDGCGEFCDGVIDFLVGEFFINKKDYWINFIDEDKFIYGVNQIVKGEGRFKVDCERRLIYLHSLSEADPWSQVFQFELLKKELKLFDLEGKPIESYKKMVF